MSIPIRLSMMKNEKVLISQLPTLFIDTPRIYNFILLLIVWVRSFRKMLPSAKLTEDKVLVFVILRKKC